MMTMIHHISLWSRFPNPMGFRELFGVILMHMLMTAQQPCNSRTHSSESITRRRLPITKQIRDGVLFVASAVVWGLVNR